HAEHLQYGPERVDGDLRQGARQGLVGGSLLPRPRRRHAPQLAEGCRGRYPPSLEPSRGLTRPLPPAGDCQPLGCDVTLLQHCPPATPTEVCDVQSFLSWFDSCSLPRRTSSEAARPRLDASPKD